MSGEELPARQPYETWRIGDAYQQILANGRPTTDLACEPLFSPVPGTVNRQPARLYGQIQAFPRSFWRLFQKT